MRLIENLNRLVPNSMIEGDKLYDNCGDLLCTVDRFGEHTGDVNVTLYSNLKYDAVRLIRPFLNKLDIRYTTDALDEFDFLTNIKRSINEHSKRVDNIGFTKLMMLADSIQKRIDVRNYISPMNCRMFMWDFLVSSNINHQTMGAFIHKKPNEIWYKDGSVYSKHEIERLSEYITLTKEDSRTYNYLGFKISNGEVVGSDIHKYIKQFINRLNELSELENREEQK